MANEKLELTPRQRLDALVQKRIENSRLQSEGQVFYLSALTHVGTDLISLLDAAGTREHRLQEYLFRFTQGLAEHPENYDGPCMCAKCQACGASDVAE